MRFFLRFFGLAAAAMLLMSSPAARADVTWTLSGTGDWSVATDWSGGAVPTGTGNADIFNGATVHPLQPRPGNVCNNLDLDSTSGGEIDPR